MKKFISVFLIAALLLTGCGASAGGKEEASGVAGSMEDAINAMYEKHKDLEMPLETHQLDLADKDLILFNLGLDNGDKLSDAAISEPMMGQPYSLILARVKNASDAKGVAQEMLEKIDMRKWICQMADTKVAAVCGDVVMFFMVNSEFADTVTTDTMLEAFKTVCTGTVTTVG